jgi:fumarate hydratase class I
MMKKKSPARASTRATGTAAKAKPRPRGAAPKKPAARPTKAPAKAGTPARSGKPSPAHKLAAPTSSPAHKPAARKSSPARRPAPARRPTPARKPAPARKPSLARKPAPARKIVAVRPAAKAPTAPPPEVLHASLLEIVRRTSAELPGDALAAISAGRKAEAEGSNAHWAMDVIEENIALAKEKSLPLCQDTGTIIFYVKVPRGFDEALFRREAEAAVAEATAKGFLRQNSVDSLTGRNSGNNLGPGTPVFHFEQWEQPGTDVRLILKGGGCENCGTQYALPDSRLEAGRDLKGVEKCLLDATWQAQGKGCGPGILGVTVGGDRATGYEQSKEQFLRKLDDENPIPELAALETRIVEKANSLGIGPMGFGGRTTLLGCKVGALNRLPASFFVSVSYMCWAFRRQGAELAPDGSIRRWLY